MPEKEYGHIMNRRKKRKKILITVSILLIFCLAGAGALLIYHHRNSMITAVSALTVDSDAIHTKSGSADDGTAVSAPETAEQKTAESETAESESTEQEAGGSETDESEAAGSESAEDDMIRQEPVKVKGIYVTGPMAGSTSMESLIQLIDETELNTVVIDVKNDEGRITYQMDMKTTQDMDACISYIGDMESLMAALKEHGIYTIARIVCFKDPCLAEARPELALKKADGTAVTDANGLAWVNPCREEVWEYLTEIAIAASESGFDEIQYDYVRFPIGSDADAADYGTVMESGIKEQMITGFLTYTTERLHEKGILVSADVFGTIIGNDVDIERVGQNYTALADTVDVLSPMVYPSHYGRGVFGYNVPDAEPYGTVLAALNDSSGELLALEETDRAIVRPWLQAFTASWVDGHISYGGEQIREQIQAVYDAGYEEWILWNARNHYTSDGLLSGDETNAENDTESSDAENENPKAP